MPPLSPSLSHVSLSPRKAGRMAQPAGPHRAGAGGIQRPPLAPLPPQAHPANPLRAHRRCMVLVNGSTSSPLKQCRLRSVATSNGHAVFERLMSVWLQADPLRTRARVGHPALGRAGRNLFFSFLATSAPLSQPSPSRHAQQTLCACVHGWPQ